MADSQLALQLQAVSAPADRTRAAGQAEPAGRDLAARSLCGEVAEMRAVRAQILRLAPLDTTVLVTGETGTGKGVSARLLHQLSARPGAFVHADCASLPPTLFESELFGHERGAFTGAAVRRKGRIERAREGTLFLDEIGELSPALQARLLRVLQDRRFERLGGSEPLRCTARVVAATSRDLRAAVQDGSFRADLYYRIAVARLRLPPLRERREDVPRLVRDGLASIGPRLGLDPPRLSERAMMRLASARWPGNVRELHNALERLAIACSGRAVGEDDLCAALEEELEVPTSTAAPAPRGVPALQPDAIAAALAASEGNVTRAARRLGVSRTTLRRRIARLGPGATAEPPVAPARRLSAAPSPPR